MQLSQNKHTQTYPKNHGYGSLKKENEIKIKICLFLGGKE